MGKIVLSKQRNAAKSRHVSFFYMLYAEEIKIRRTWILWMHILMPLIGIAVFLSYYRVSMWSDWGKISGYIEVVSVICPALVGFVCALSAEQEAQAGHFQNILGTGRTRWKMLAAKLCFLLLWNLAAVSLAIGGFGIGFHFFVSETGASAGFYISVILLIWISQIFGYGFHLFLGLRFSKGITIGAGIVESVTGALMLTGLGEGIWQWLPCAWAGRLSGYWVRIASGTGIDEAFILEQMKFGGAVAAGITLIGIGALCWWFSRYEGRQVED